MQYSADITLDKHTTITDRGTGFVSLQVQPGSSQFNNFFENFVSTTPLSEICDKVKDKPGTDKDKCKIKS